MDGYPEPLLRELVGAVLRAERRRQGRTLSQVAETAGISMQHLSDVERGRKDPSSELLAAITGALGLDITRLLLRVADDASFAPMPERPLVLDLGSDPGRGPVAALGRSADPVGRPGLTLLAVA